MPCGAAAMRSWLARYQGRICLLFVFAAIVALHVFALGHRFVADDAWFARILDRQPLGEFLAFRYMHWSGRVPIEATLVLVINHPWVWRLINAAMLLLFCHSAGRLALASTGTSGATTTSLAFAFLMLVSPDILYPAAWWMTGSVNYLWPAALWIGRAHVWTQVTNAHPLSTLPLELINHKPATNHQRATPNTD